MIIFIEILIWIVCPDTLKKVFILDTFCVSIRLEKKEFVLKKQLYN